MGTWILGSHVIFPHQLPTPARYVTYHSVTYTTRLCVNHRTIERVISVKIIRSGDTSSVRMHESPPIARNEINESNDMKNIKLVHTFIHQD